MEDYEIDLNKLYVRVIFLFERFKIPKGSITNGMYKNKNDKDYYHWEYRTKNSDKRIKLIRYDTIPISYVKKYNLPKEEALKVLLKLEKGEQIRELEQEKKDHTQLYFDITYNHQYQNFIAFYAEYYRTQEKIVLLAKTHAILYLIISLQKDGTNLKTLHKYFTGYELNIKANHINSFYRTLRLCEEYSIEQVVIHGLEGQKIIKKITPIHQKILKKFYRDAQQFSYAYIFKHANLIFLELEISELSLSTIKRYLSQTDIQNQCNPFRYGKKWTYENIEKYILREEFDYPNEQWQIDGSPMQFKYWSNKENKVKRLCYFIVIDSFSRKIVGHSISDTENEELVVKALENAIIQTQCLPKDILYDSARAFSGKRIKHIIEKSTYLGVNWRQCKPENPRDKGKVERIINTYQTTVCSSATGFIGEGIRSRRKTFSRTKKKKAEIEKKKNLGTREELINMFDQLILEYNQNEINGKPTASTLYLSKKPSPGLKITNHIIAKLFWNGTKATMENSIIKTQKDGIDYHYELTDENLSTELNNNTFKIYKHPLDHSEIYLFNLKTDEYIMNLPRCSRVNPLSGKDLYKIKHTSEYNKRQLKFLETNKKNEETSLQNDLNELMLSKAGKDLEKIRNLRSAEKRVTKSIFPDERKKISLIEKMEKKFNKKGSYKILNYD